MRWPRTIRSARPGQVGLCVRASPRVRPTWRPIPDRGVRPRCRRVLGLDQGPAGSRFDSAVPFRSGRAVQPSGLTPVPIPRGTRGSTLRPDPGRMTSPARSPFSRIHHDRHDIRSDQSIPLADLCPSADLRAGAVRDHPVHLPGEVFQPLDPGEDDLGERQHPGAGRDVVPQGESEYHRPLEDHGLPGGPVGEGRDDDPGAGSPLPGRRQRPERRPGADRRQPGRHPAVVQAGRGDRPGRPQRAGSRADQRESQGHPLPRPELQGGRRSTASPRTAFSSRSRRR